MNTPGAVVIRAEGALAAISRFRTLLKKQAPRSARMTRVCSKKVTPSGASRFEILQSRMEGIALSTIPPDIATCPACIKEMSDPDDRRYRYPFTNCTNCGPRFTIVSSLPYDRERTSMSAFKMCPACRREYANPSDRRFHAEPNACPKCGPRLSLFLPEGVPTPVLARNPIDTAAAALAKGKIVALRGLGGFQLAADATNEEAVQELRRRKGREEKPFAVMFSNMAAAKTAARITKADEAILLDPCAAILLCPSRADSPLAPSVSLKLPTVGVFLPYTPMHRLLLSRVERPLVMTSGNRTDEPIAIGNEEAFTRLGNIADLFLLHDREIIQRSDDSVVRRVGSSMYPIRRARGFVPAPVSLSRSFPDVVGLGADLKGTFCFIRENAAYLSQHLGDLELSPSREFYEETFQFFRKFLDAKPTAVCHDLHPAYFTTSFAATIEGSDHFFALQHHKAHIYSVMAETGFSGKAVGAAFDGTGYGEDGTIWGGEFFTIEGDEVTRAGHLSKFPLPGGDAAIREPWRTALSLLRETLGRTDAEKAARNLFPDIPDKSLLLLLDALDQNINIVPTSSAGRLFDAASAIAGVCTKAAFEGQAPMLFEAAASQKFAGRYPFSIVHENGLIAVDWKELVANLASDATTGKPLKAIARRFHDTLALAILEVISQLAEGIGARHAILSGGVFQNATLLDMVLSGLRQKRMIPLIHRQVPTNDGGISLGQAYFAALRVAGR